MGKFVIIPSKDGKLYFNIVASNGQVVGTSEMYESNSSAINGIESVKKNCSSDIEDQTAEGYETKKNPKWELYTDKAGEYRWRLKAGNGQKILSSEGYKAKASAINGIESVRKNAADANIVEELE